MSDCVTSAGPAITPASAGKRGADAEHQHEHARHVVAEHRHHVRDGSARLDDEADAGAREHDEQHDEDRRPRSAA